MATLRIPKMDDLEILRQLREIDKEVGVIMVTAVNEAEIARQAMAMGAFDYITPNPWTCPIWSRACGISPNIAVDLIR